MWIPSLILGLLSAAGPTDPIFQADLALTAGDFDAAIVHFDEAIRLDPLQARAFHGRGVAYFHNKDYAKAISSCSEAIRLEPRNDGAIYDRGLAYWHSGDGRNAVRDFERAIEINPQSDSAYNALAWALATSPIDALRDGKRAVVAATKACELTDWNDPHHLSTPAAAYAEVGDFDQAVKRHKQAMASPKLPHDKLDRARGRLELYERRLPYRETCAP